MIIKIVIALLAILFIANAIIAFFVASFIIDCLKAFFSSF